MVSRFRNLHDSTVLWLFFREFAVFVRLFMPLADRRNGGRFPSASARPDTSSSNDFLVVICKVSQFVKRIVLDFIINNDDRLLFYVFQEDDSVVYVVNLALHLISLVKE
jgi:hypothetical protein